MNPVFTERLCHYWTRPSRCQLLALQVSILNTQYIYNIKTFCLHDVQKYYNSTNKVDTSGQKKIRTRLHVYVSCFVRSTLHYAGYPTVTCWLRIESHYWCRAPSVCPSSCVGLSAVMSHSFLSYMSVHYTTMVRKTYTKYTKFEDT